MGGYSYTVGELVNILNQSVGIGSGANGLISLAHQVIATLLNLECDSISSAYVTATSGLLIVAHMMMSPPTLQVPPVGIGFLFPATTDIITDALDNIIKTYECDETG